VARPVALSGLTNSISVVSSLRHQIIEVLRGANYIERRLDAGVGVTDEDRDLLRRAARHLKNAKQKSGHLLDAPRENVDAEREAVIGALRMAGLLAEWRPGYTDDPMSARPFSAQRRDGAVTVRAHSTDELLDLMESLGAIRQLA
jgi:hypothetical protein